MSTKNILLYKMLADKKKSHSMSISSIVLLLVTISVSITTITINGGFRTSSLLEIIHIAIIVISAFSIFSFENNSFSLYKSFHLFNLFFVGIAPVIQYKYNVGLWAMAPLKLSESLYASSIYLLAIVVFNCVYISRYRKLNPLKFKGYFHFFSENHPIKLSKNKLFLIILFSVIAFFAIFWLNNYSLSSLLVRGGEDKEYIDGASKMQRLIISKFFQPMNMILFLFVFSFAKSKLLKIYLFIMAVLSASPTGLSRFATASLYLPLLLSFAFFRKKNVYVTSFILGLLFIFPAMSVFRYGINGFELHTVSSNIFRSVDFDSYFIYATILKKDVVTYGYQFLGVLFFWVPRSIWPGKPLGSGETISGMYNFSQTNISCHFFGEGYINFGFFGLFLFAILLAYIYATIDRLYWTLCSQKGIYYATIIYAMIIAESFLMIRGDLMSSTAFLCGFVTSYVFVRKVVIT